MSTPVFAVLGHPNKGKSSIVATLAHDDSVAIGPVPGTTVRCRAYPMQVDGEVLYILVDTPGFQRARRALQWLREHETTAARHAEVVQQFVTAHRGGELFYDEVELLTPVLEGAGILYVVDGSVPYGPEYEPEMEILRWTGRPRMALVNPIGAADHVEEWREALGQYFHVVRVFNALTAEADKQVELLRTFGHLDEGWSEALERAVAVLEQEHSRRRARAARMIAHALVEMLTLTLARKLSADADPEPLKPALERRFQEHLRTLERQCRDQVQEVYEHGRVTRVEPDLETLREDLFSEETWNRFGLSRSQLATLGAGSGALLGGTIDVALGGASFLLGTMLGAGVGAVAAWMGASSLAEVKVASIPLGGKKLLIGPTRNKNFPHVVFGRARLHHFLVARRAHSRRDPLDCGADPLAPPTDAQRKSLERCFEGLRKGQEVEKMLGELAQMIEHLLATDEGRAREHT